MAYEADPATQGFSAGFRRYARAAWVITQTAHARGRGRPYIHP
jgi:hypothetical protein